MSKLLTSITMISLLIMTTHLVDSNDDNKNESINTSAANLIPVGVLQTISFISPHLTNISILVVLIIILVYICKIYSKFQDLRLIVLNKFHTNFLLPLFQSESED
jgi:hypothetical protein